MLLIEKSLSNSAMEGHFLDKSTINDLKQDLIQKLKDKAGAQYKLQPVAKEWPDVQKGAGRQSVSRDFLFDEHVMVGVMRFGPDLSNIGRNILFDKNTHSI